MTWIGRRALMPSEQEAEHREAVRISARWKRRWERRQKSALGRLSVDTILDAIIWSLIAVVGALAWVLVGCPS